MNPATLNRLADRVDRNVPKHGDPESFHVEKSDIAGELRGMARNLEAAHEPCVRTIWKDGKVIGQQRIENVADLLFLRGDIEGGATLDEIRNPGRGE